MKKNLKFTGLQVLFFVFIIFSLFSLYVSAGANSLHDLQSRLKAGQVETTVQTENENLSAEGDSFENLGGAGILSNMKKAFSKAWKNIKQKVTEKAISLYTKVKLAFKSKPPVVETDILKVPVRNQLSVENGPNGKIYCGPTCLQMVLGYYNTKKSAKELAQLCLTDKKNTTHTGDMVKAAKQCGMAGTYCKTLTLGALSNLVKQGKPVIVNVDTKKHGFGEGHYMVVTGIKDGKVHVNDPWKGQKATYSFSTFNAMWSTRVNKAIVLQK